MKILHTADWHLGKRLHQTDLSEDHQFFFSWLIETIEKEKVDALLISGDVFDLANPSSEARQLYYETLVKINKLKCQVIITGGNHDSPAVLNAPREILKALNISVVGSLPESIDDLLIPLRNANEQPELVVAAIPFLRDVDLRQAVKDETYEEREEAIRNGIRKVFDEAAEVCKRIYPNVPAIAMGHLYASGASTSDSEREIQIGNLAGFDAANFNNYFSYIALGHIHRPQQAGGTNALYSGSPVPLSFSEKNDQKRVILLETSSNGIDQIKSIRVPLARKLMYVKGDLKDIQEQLKNPNVPDSGLTSLIEIELVEDQYDPAVIIALENFIEQFRHPHAEIVKHRIQFKNRIDGTTHLFHQGHQIRELRPTEVFERRMEKEALPEDQKKLLREAFNEILESIYQDEQT